ncbi:hypothetical protein GWK47_023202 [Chionoecetes opilio]|uniref:Uncharacterized protein n=1 Tax=Chionoecetes opilio TaxID=41210 RepID=A0A8J5BU77_CHIOP|nr:hypothetical protein GWK47_023202 [Chionoecetes opilio]
MRRTFTLVSSCTYKGCRTNRGTAKCQLRTVDTDVVVLAMHPANRLNISELWIAFWKLGKSFRGKKTAWNTWITYGDVTNPHSAPWVPCQTHVPLTSGCNHWSDLWSRCKDRTSTEEGVNQGKETAVQQERQSY